MTVLKATQSEYNTLNQYRNNNNVLKFTKDGNNNWIVGLSVLESPAFAAIYADLDALERIEYIPPEQEEIDGI